MKDNKNQETSDLFGEAAPLMPPKTQRVLDAAVEIKASRPAGDQIDYLHSIMCQVGMPRKRTSGRSFERKSGHASMLLEAGKLWNGTQFVDQPLPYGTKPRLVMIHVTTEAVKTSSRSVEIGKSIRQYLIKLGIDPTGGLRGNYAMFKRQMEALAACRLTLGMSSFGRHVTVDAKPFSKFEAWLTTDDAQQVMWPGVLELSQPFYETLCQHSVPLDNRAIAVLKDSALELDVYSWLAHRLWRVEAAKGEPVSWLALKHQFGQEYRQIHHFQQKLRHALRAVCAVYPDANLSETDAGFTLLPSRPPVPTVPKIRNRRIGTKPG